MEFFLSLMAEVYTLLNYPITVWGFTFSFWGIGIFSALAIILVRFVVGVIRDD